MNEPKQKTATEQVKAVLSSEIKSGGTIKEALGNVLKVLKEIPLEETQKIEIFAVASHIKQLKGQQRRLKPCKMLC